jgi:hypothetical protein
MLAIVAKHRGVKCLNDVVDLEPVAGVHAELDATIAPSEGEAMLAALHPQMATAYGQKVEQLEAALGARMRSSARRHGRRCAASSRRS